MQFHVGVMTILMTAVVVVNYPQFQTFYNSHTFSLLPDHFVVLFYLFPSHECPALCPSFSVSQSCSINDYNDDDDNDYGKGS